MIRLLRTEPGDLVIELNRIPDLLISLIEKNWS